MPTYEYTCRSCGGHLEATQKFTDDPLTECPTCGGELRKVFGNVGIVFKGSGFYKNDSRSSKANTTASSSESSSTSKETPSGSDATTPAAPAAPATPAPATPAPASTTTSS